MAFKMTPFHLTQPNKVQGGNYRNPATIIDRSAEILTNGLQQGVDNFVDTYMEAKDGGVSDKEIKPKINKEAVDKEFEKTNYNDAFEDTSSYVKKFNDFKPGDIEVIKPDSAVAMQAGKGSPNQFFGAGIAAGAASAGRRFGGGQVDLQSLAQGGGDIAGILGRALQNQQAQQTAGAAQAQQAGAAQVAAAGAAPVAGVTNPFEGQTFTITPAQMNANLGVFGKKESRDRSVKR